jgi:thiamine-phosphate pyrophosphorylase
VLSLVESLQWRSTTERCLTTTTPRCRLYLATPRLSGGGESERLATAFSAAIAAADIACLLLRCAPGLDDGAIRSAVERLRPLAQGRDIAFLIEDRVDLVWTVGADGVHVNMAVAYDEARRRLGPDMIVGVACDARDDAITVAEHGADYVAFGEFDDPSPAAATIELTEWWSEIMTVPCVGAGCASAADATRLQATGADFIAIGTAVWGAPPGLAETLRGIVTALSSVIAPPPRSGGG